MTTGQFTLSNFKDFFATALFRESFWNSLYVGIMSVLIASALSMPLAYFTSRFEFRGAVIVHRRVMPQFVVEAPLIRKRRVTTNVTTGHFFVEHFGPLTI